MSENSQRWNSTIFIKTILLVKDGILQFLLKQYLGCNSAGRPSEWGHGQ